jgi:hypothetical protein
VESRSLGVNLGSGFFELYEHWPKEREKRILHLIDYFALDTCALELGQTTEISQSKLLDPSLEIQKEGLHVCHDQLEFGSDLEHALSSSQKLFELLSGAPAAWPFQSSQRLTEPCLTEQGSSQVHDAPHHSPAAEGELIAKEHPTILEGIGDGRSFLRRVSLEDNLKGCRPPDRAADFDAITVLEDNDILSRTRG